MKTSHKPEKPAAAIALVVTCDTPSILMVRRAENPQDPWSGQWAFPGGRVEDSDIDLLATCQREVMEECGCELTPAQFKHVLPLSPAGRMHRDPVIVTPFLWEIPTAVDLIPDKNEVASAHWQELAYLLEPANHKSGMIAPNYSDREFPYILLDNTPLWGFTYGVLMDYLNLFKN